MRANGSDAARGVPFFLISLSVLLILPSRNVTA
jgi:hypothetical protein